MRHCCVKGGMRSLGVLVAAAICAAPLLAQEYPTKPIRYIVPFGAGGPTDTQARWVAQRLTSALGQQVIVDNRPAAGGVPGTAAVAKSPADGYTLLAGNPGPLTVAFAITQAMPYETLRDFIPVILVAKSASALVVHPALPVNNLREFIGFAKSRPGRLNYGTPGVGTVGHLGTEAFARQAGIVLNHVPYKGGVNQYTIELMSGYIEVASLQLFTATPLVRQGKLRALAVTSKARSVVMPEIATMTEQGLPFENYNWNGVLLPARTPAAIVTKLHQTISAALTEGRDTFVKQGQEPGGEGPEQYAAFLRDELDRYAKVAAAAGIPKQ